MKSPLGNGVIGQRLTNYWTLVVWKMAYQRKDRKHFFIPIRCSCSRNKIKKKPIPQGIYQG
jgi:hypothetical protein